MLPQKYIDKARNELREDDIRKEQALKHFREWISKHPFIKNIRQGNNKDLWFVEVVLKRIFDSQMTYFCFNF